MANDQKYTIRKIIYWKNRIDEIEIFLYTTNLARAEKTIFEKSYKVKFFGTTFFNKVEKSINLEKEMFLMFYQWLKEYKEHLENLVRNSDEELVSIADAIRDGEITKEGLNI